MKLTHLALTAALFIAPAAAALAQNGGYLPPSAANGQTIQARKYDQQSRIRQGDRSGELTRGETRHLEGQEHAINREEHFDRRTNGGHLTGSEKRTIDRQQNHVSNHIYNAKHNARVR